ncbi:MAG: DUF402 domain-containing protein [Halanaeroarchaeum sp.]
MTAAAPDAPRVRVRGIYATALTRRLTASADATVVQPSDAIADRFEDSFAIEPADVRIETTRDRVGIGITGDREGVRSVRNALAGVGIDALSWEAIVPPGAVFAGTIEGTTGGGAIVSLADGREGYLPFDATAEYVSAGDAVRVQVRDPAAPWVDARPTLGTDLRVPGAVASLVRGVERAVADAPDGRRDHELVRTTDLLGTTVPANWGIDWHRPATDLDVGALDAVLGDLVDRATALEDALESADGLRLATPLSSAWIRFGRQSRFALDRDRRAVTETMHGHHRTKAADELASSAVDFAERLGAETEAFPFDAVTTAFGPGEGDRLAIEHGKPDGRGITLGRGTVTAIDHDASRVTVEREMSGGGTYDALDVERVAGDVATTRFTEGRWWYPTVYRSADGDRRGTYVNVSTPVEIFPDAVRYVDLHVDVVERADGTVAIVDEDELEAAVAADHLPASLAQRARSVAEEVADALDGSTR